jgi:hypothetical protein
MYESLGWVENTTISSSGEIGRRKGLKILWGPLGRRISFVADLAVLSEVRLGDWKEQW